MNTLIEIATEYQSRLEQTTARLAEMAAEHATALAEKDAEIATLTAERDGVYQFRDNLLQMLASGADPLDVAKEALGTLEEKRRSAALAQAQELKAQAAAIEAQLGISP